MRVPGATAKDPSREEFFLDIREKCRVSMMERRQDYSARKSYYVYGAAPGEKQAMFNKIQPHIDTVSSFVYSSETTRFSTNLGASVGGKEKALYAARLPALNQAINDKWHDSNGDTVFDLGVTWAMVYNTTLIKLVINRHEILPYFVEPSCFGVLREDTPFLDRQEAFVHAYYLTKSELAAQLYRHPNREKILKALTASPPPQPAMLPAAVQNIIISQSSPNVQGVIDIPMDGMVTYNPRVSEDVIEMSELWLWDDDAEDYRVVTIAEPNVLIFDNLAAVMFLKGEHPFTQICANPLPDYFWGQSEVEKLILLQMRRSKTADQNFKLLDKQVDPPKAGRGVLGNVDEVLAALNSAGGTAQLDENGKIDEFKPDVPEDLWKTTSEIDAMFAEASAINAVLAGRGETGVRSKGHASELARLGSSRIKKRALKIEDSLERVATLYLKLMQVYDKTHYMSTDGTPFTAEQFTKDFQVKVDGHSNSPIFVEDSRALAFDLFKAGAVKKDKLIELTDPPMKQQLSEDVKTIEAKEAAAAQAQAQQKGG